MFKFLSNNPLSNAYRNIKSILDPDQKRRALLMIGLLLINALFDFAGLATIGTLIISALQDNIFEGPSYIRGAEESDITYFLNDSLRSLYDFFGATNHILFLFYLSIIIFIAFIIKNGVSIYIIYIQSKFAFNISLRLNKKMFKYFYDQGYLFIKDSTSGKKVYSIVDIPMRFASHYLSPLLVFWTEVVVILIIAIALLFVNAKAVLLLGLTIAPMFYLIYSFTKNKVRYIGLKRNELMPVNYAKVFEAMNGFVDVKLSNNENEALERYIRNQRVLNKVDAKFFGIYQKLNQRTNDIVFGMGILVIFGYAHFTGMSTEEVLALLGLFAMAAYKFLPSINRMLHTLIGLKNHSYVFDELKKIKGVQLMDFDLAQNLEFNSTLEVSNLSFKYPKGEEKVINQLSFTVKKGETIGFVGSSGSGKTTLLKILLRLLDDHQGDILIDRQIINKDNKASYQKIIGYVEQEIFILNDTIISNVAFGVEDPDEEQVWESLKEAQLDEFVRTHPDGLQMMLGERGVNLSGGQKQRIGIARALFKNSKILMFDEATSALDGQTERAVVESINHLSNLGKTVLIVAHRISTLEKCNRIYSLKNGSIESVHSYKELCAIKEKEMAETTHSTGY